MELRYINKTKHLIASSTIQFKKNRPAEHGQEGDKQVAVAHKKKQVHTVL
jgi:hypothetical protein